MAKLTVNGNPTDTAPDQAGVDADLGGPVSARVARIIERLRPSIQADGGDIEFVSVDDKGVVTIRLHGACVGCPSSSMTLKLGVERNLREHIPEISGVRAVE